uniref:Zinc knuckle CX2CX4HX4C n=1 Tax=Tanacetum cinerariifolium TaxID=118510 RepID=A0A6L2L8N9_TANCI|nr:zinc knuckle CX2CX4HX4C [Tanacetum cinerariifolium]
MERRFLSQKGSGVGRGLKEKQVSIADKSVEVIKHTNVVNTSLESFQAISKVHGIHSSTSNEENMNDAESIRAISERFANTAYGFVLEKRMAYPVFANYVRNTWGKYGLVKSVINSSTEILSFQFSSMEGLDAMLENGPCYARALIEIQADIELKDNIVVAMPKPVGEQFYTCNVRVDTGCVGMNTLEMEQRFLSQKGSGVGRGVNEKQVSIADKPVEVSKHTNVVNSSLESFQAISKVHGIHSPTSNEENMNDACTTVKENQEKEKIESKPDKNRKRKKGGKSAINSRELVISKMGSTIADDSFGCTEPGEQRFKKFNNNSSVIRGERLGFNPFGQIETENSLSMGDEHLDTISATESDEVIKSSVENLVPIPSEFEGIPDTMCDVHLDNNHTPLEAKDHFEIVINSNDDISSSDDDSLHE